MGVAYSNEDVAYSNEGVAYSNVGLMQKKMWLPMKMKSFSLFWDIRWVEKEVIIPLSLSNEGCCLFKRGFDAKDG